MPEVADDGADGWAGGVGGHAHAVGGVGDVVHCAIVAWETGAVAEDVEESDVIRRPFVLKDEVVADELGDWCCPLDLWVVLVVVDEEGYCCRGESFCC